ncbi:MAG TPA: hypothetical protein VOA00_12265 [Thermoanaerobaculia bacterium]|nr:hypothetical protein [Thermoanaerobaculia bacterium]
MKHRLRNLLIACAAAGLFAATRDARGQVTPAEGYTPPDDTLKVNVGGTIFADYTYQDAPTSTDADGGVIHPNSFNLSRAYINVTGQISHWVSFRITPDITRQTVSGTGVTLNTNNSLVFRLKYAYGQINFDDFTTHGSWLRIGTQQTPYVDFEEGVYRYRFQGTIFVDREGFLSSSDFGASVHWNIPMNYGDVHVGVYNGETYSGAEVNNQKAFQARVTIRPAPGVPIVRGLRITGFYDGDHYETDAERKRAVAMLSFENPWVNAGFDYLDAKDRTSRLKTFSTHATGWSAWVTPRTPIGVEALLRYDEIKPNKDNNTVDPNGKKKRFIGGVSYWFPVTKAGIAAAVLLDYENVKYDGFAAGNANNKPEEKRYAVHTLFNF